MCSGVFAVDVACVSAWRRGSVSQVSTIWEERKEAILG